MKAVQVVGLITFFRGADIIDVVRKKMVLSLLPKRVGGITTVRKHVYDGSLCTIQ